VPQEDKDDIEQSTRNVFPHSSAWLEKAKDKVFQHTKIGTLPLI